MILSAFLLIAALAVLARLIFGLAVYALPVLAGVSAVAAAHATGAGWVGALVVGFVAGIVVLALGQSLFALAASPILQLLVGLAYALPAAAAGFGLAYGILDSSAAVWRVALALAAATALGAVAFKRVAALAPSPVTSLG